MTSPYKKIFITAIIVTIALLAWDMSRADHRGMSGQKIFLELIIYFLAYSLSIFVVGSLLFMAVRLLGRLAGNIFRQRRE